LSFVRPLLAQPGNGWSIGVFGAIGEFHRADDERCAIDDLRAALSAITARGALRVAPQQPLRAIAYDTLGSDGETWGAQLDLCAPWAPPGQAAVIRALGPDHAALREADRDAQLFDLGVGLGNVHMCIRTADPELIATLHAACGQPALGEPMHALFAGFLRTQPHRVMLSPAGRLEVMAPIPMPDGRSPDGPHTHLLPRLLQARRTHSANAPIPDGWQPVLSLHPRSAWRDALGERKPYDRDADAQFEQLLAMYAPVEDRAVRARVEAAFEAGQSPQSFDWPQGRRARAQARITLRRIAVARPGARIDAWRDQHDRAAADAGANAVDPPGATAG
jgi:hypothetical protein